MTKKHSLIIFVAVVGFSACEKPQVESISEPLKPLADPDMLILSETAVKNAALVVKEAGPAEIRQEMKLQGELKAVPEHLAAIVARLDGVVTGITKKEGDHVEKDEAIVTIESNKLARMKMDYLEAEQRLRFAKKALRREAGLLEKKISSKEAYQKVAHEKKEAEISHAAALQHLKTLGFSEKFLHRLEKNPNQRMTKYTLKAPFQGEIIAKNVTLGEAVVEDKILFRLADLSELQVEVNVPMKAVPLFEKEGKVQVVCDMLNLVDEGVISFVASIANPETRTVPVRINIKNPDGKWRPGMPARIELHKTEVRADVAVPVGAIQEIAGNPSIFVQSSPGSFRLVPVKTGAIDGRSVEILDGLAAGDKVVVENSLTLKSEWLRR